MSLALRLAGGLAAFAVTAVLALAFLGGPGESAAPGPWTLVTVVAVPVGIIAYALIELAQTKRVDSLARQLEVRVLVLMPVAIALNIVLGTVVASVLKIPVYLDSVGTVLVAALGGPLAGALTGLFSNTIWTYLAPPPFQSPFAAPFAIVAVVIGLMAGSVARWGWLRPRPGASDRQLVAAGVVTLGLVLAMAAFAVGGWAAVAAETGASLRGDDPVALVLGGLALALIAGIAGGILYLLARRRDTVAAGVVAAGLATGLVSAFIAAPIAAGLFGGVTGSGADFVVAAFRQGGADLQAAVLGQSLMSDSIDKVATYLLVYLVLGSLSARIVARFPQGDRLVAVGRPASASGDRPGTGP
jgi:hypothetical protein